MSNQFDLTRSALLSFIENNDEKTADVQPEYFNNTIRWHIGHVLVTPEALLFGFPNQSENVPKYFSDLFNTGTKPADWQDTPPSLSVLITQLEQQRARMKELTNDFLQQDLPYTLPFGNFKTFGDVYEMILQHENEHLGKMKAMKQVVDAL
ncbi:DinB family protein [Oceanobacillus manasiensis]|uniref:DinB family protein n=1 Tax=Oceanobacillus manasiensis TaxID=586413 RepID=UPI0005A6D1C5|nr:DinB family protein [Oceanobacillus manasiensis]